MALQGSVEEIRTSQEHFSLKIEKKIKSSQPQTKFTDYYKKECIPFCFNLYISPSCHILSKALDMLRNTPFNSKPLSKEIKIS